MGLAFLLLFSFTRGVRVFLEKNAGALIKRGILEHLSILSVGQLRV